MLARSLPLFAAFALAVVAAGVARPAASVPPAQRPALGANLADLKNAHYLTDLGFTWMKGFLAWERIEPQPGQRDWTDLDKALPVLDATGLKLLLRVDRAPAWSRPSNQHPGAPPDPAYYGAWAAFLTDLARRGRGRVAAYEVWNEPNLSVEWGGRPADPEAYVRFLEVSYRALKRGDPRAVVVGFSLAPTHGSPAGAMDTLVFLERAYAAGAGRWFDVYGAHPYGFGLPPEAEGRFAFRSIELERALMERYGDGHKPVWATEWGWQLTPSVEGRLECLAQPAWRDAKFVEESTAAEYMARALDLARRKWPWMQAMFLFNLDFSMAPWYEDRCEPMLYHAILSRHGEPRLPYHALRALARGAAP